MAWVKSMNKYPNLYKDVASWYALIKKCVFLGNICLANDDICSLSRGLFIKIRYWDKNDNDPEAECAVCLLSETPGSLCHNPLVLYA